MIEDLRIVVDICIIPCIFDISYNIYVYCIYYKEIYLMNIKKVKTVSERLTT